MPICCGAEWIAGNWQPLSRTRTPFLALLKPSLRPVLPLTPPCLAMHGRQASPACLSPSPLSQDIPAREEHADVQIPQVMREFITRGAWAIQEWQPDQSLELARSLRLAREAQVADSETHTQKRTGRHGAWSTPGRWASRDLPSAFRDNTANHEPGGQVP